MTDQELVAALRRLSPDDMLNLKTLTLEAAERIETLSVKLLSLQDLVSPEAVDPKIKRLKIEEGQLEMVLDVPKKLAALIANSFIDMLDGMDAKNYIEMEFMKGARRVTVTIQRPHAKTPHQLKEQAERERDEARAELAQLKEPQSFPYRPGLPSAQAVDAHAHKLGGGWWQYKREGSPPKLMRLRVRSLPSLTKGAAPEILGLHSDAVGWFHMEGTGWRTEANPFTRARLQADDPTSWAWRPVTEDGDPVPINSLVPTAGK